MFMQKTNRQNLPIFPFQFTQCAITANIFFQFLSTLQFSQQSQNLSTSFNHWTKRSGAGWSGKGKKRGGESAGEITIMDIQRAALDVLILICFIQLRTGRTPSPPHPAAEGVKCIGIQQPSAPDVPSLLFAPCFSPTRFRPTVRQRAANHLGVAAN